MKIKIENTINASKSNVWKAYTEPKHIVNWNFASDDWCCPNAETDLKVGGKYLARMEAKDGSFGFDFEAVFDEIQPEEKLVYTIADGRKVSTTFQGDNDKTHIVTEFEAENHNPVEMQRDGWQAILNHFKDYVEKQ